MCNMLVFDVLLVSVVAMVMTVAANDTTLELVHVYFRHGDRTPDKKDFYPTDPYKNHLFYPMGLGQLTNKGKIRSYNLGSLLRSRYNDFLGKIYSPEVILASSTDYDRTKMSLLLVLAGLWPPSPMQQWNNMLLWQPIPINYKTMKHDYNIQRPIHYCPKYVEELEKLYESNEVRNVIDRYKNIFYYIEQWTGKSMKKPINIFDVYQNLNAEESLNLTLPEWTKQIYPEPIQTIAGMQCQFENYNDILIRLNGGRQLKYIIEAGQSKIKGNLNPAGRKMFLVSGHENNINNILAALNLFSHPHVPKYGSAVIIELHRKSSNEQYSYGYKIFYHNSTTEDPIMLSIPGCSEFCPVDHFIKLTAKYIPGNYTVECESQIDLD